MKLGISQKIILLFIFLTIILSGFMGGYLIWREKSLLLSEFDERARMLLVSADDNAEYPLLVGNREALDKIGAGLLKQRDIISYAIMDKQGNVLSQGGEGARGRSRDYSAPILAERQGTEEDLLLGSGASSTEEIGKITLVFSTHSLEQKSIEARNIIGLLVLVGVILAVVLINLLVRFMLGRPIHILTEGIRIISAGDLSYKVSLKTSDEIGLLATSFNKMTEDLQKTTVSIGALQEEQKRFADVALSTGDWIWEVDENGKYLYSSAMSEDILGYTPQEIMGKHFFDFFHPEDKDRLKEEAFEIFSRKGTFKNFLSRRVRKDGQAVIVETTAMPILDKEGRLRGYRGAIRDITERRKAEEELESAYERLKDVQAQLVQSAKMASVGVLAGGVAHEINNPLTGVLNTVQLIKMIAQEKKDFNIDEFNELLGIIEISAQRCATITRSLLDFSHASKGVSQKILLADIIEKVVSLINHEMGLQNISIKKEIEADLPEVMGDSQLLQQVIFDILNNAKWAIEKKADGEGGEMTIKTHYDPAKKEVQLFLSDTGVGIAKKDLDKIFEPFFTTKNVGEGTGLGLAIVYSIVKAHKGTIDVQSEPGKGTTFKITLPAFV